MDCGFADRIVEYVDAKAIRSFLGVKRRTSLFPGEMMVQEAFPFFHSTLRAGAQNMGNMDYDWRHGSNVLNAVSQKSRGCGRNPAASRQVDALG
jgi:hypothetical protein